MIDATLEIRDLVSLANTLAVLPIVANQAQEAELRRLVRDTLKVVRERSDTVANPSALIHELSGALVNSLRPTAVSLVARGTVQGSIEPTSSHAEYEVAKGGEHDYVTRTLRATEDLRDEAAARLARIIIEEVQG